jgi:uncharacterized protein YjbI with pentapeptide repeats
MIRPERAAVRPRIILEAGARILLEDAVRPLIEQATPALVVIIGTAQSGKSTALRHLAAVFPNANGIQWVDDADLGKQRPTPVNSLTVTTRMYPHTQNVAAIRFTLAPWNDDDILEYVLNRHRDRSESILRRALADDHRTNLWGNPALLSAALHSFAHDASLKTFTQALAAFVNSTLATELDREAIRALCYRIATRVDRPDHPTMDLFPVNSRIAARALNLESVQFELASRYVLEELQSRRGVRTLKPIMPRGLLDLVAPLINGNPPAMSAIHRAIEAPDAEWHSLAASLLLRIHPMWRPPKHVRSLHRGCFNGANWSKCELSDANLSASDLSHADLSESNLADSRFAYAKLANANLHGASLADCEFRSASLDRADLSATRAGFAQYHRASLRHANFSNALLESCVFDGADVSGARFIRANLRFTSFIDTALAETDFSHADLEEAKFHRAVLSRCILTGASFRRARLHYCDLECVRLPGAVFEGAIMQHCLLTGSFMPHGNFRHADLTNAALAEIDWERADLSGADLRKATFHMGSSRSGLLFTPYASEGSKTGFYTDEYFEQSYLAPEQIRKANLRGADLRGAIIDGVDFYLVDLRGALYDDSQADWLRKCGAILQARV